MPAARWTTALFLALAMSLARPAVAQSPPPALDRATATPRLARVQRGMSRAQVRTLLGAPDDTLTRLDPELEPTTIVTELWSYGAERHGGFPALGSVGFTAAGQVFSVEGARGAPPAPGAMAERDLRALFALLGAVPGFAGHEYDPRPVIRAVNALLPLGAARALDVIGEYVRVAPSYTAFGTDGVFLVLRALFDPPAGDAHPTMLVGQPFPANPGDPRVFPAFPLVLVDDVPLLLVRGYSLAGEAQQPDALLPWYRAHGVLRRAPLAPGAAHPLGVLADFEREPRASQVLDTGATRVDLRTMLMEQLLRLVADVYHPPFVAPTDEHFTHAADPSAQWSTMVADVDRLGARWDAARSGYAVAGVAPAAPSARRPRVQWSHTERGVRVTVLLERLDRDRARSWLHYEHVGAGAARVAGSIELAVNDGTRRVLEHYALAEASTGTYSVMTFALAAGQSVTARIDQAGHAASSPAMVP